MLYDRLATSGSVGAMGGEAMGERAFERFEPELAGTKLGRLIEPCPSYGRASRPPTPEPGPPIAVAISGGGFRATLSGLGVLRFLADAGLLGRVRYVSSVSGGSIANGRFAVTYPRLAEAGFAPEAFDRLALVPVVERIARGSFSAKLLGGLWRTVGRGTRTTVLADGLANRFLGQTMLHELDPTCRFIFNAANLVTAARFGFEREFVGDYVVGTLPTETLGLRVADAVAASAAVPGVFAAYTPRGRFPCARGNAPKLVDGGAYENTALEPIDGLREAFLVALNAGGIFRPGPLGWLPIVRDLQRSQSLLYRQSTALRMRAMVERFQAWERARDEGRPAPEDARRGVLFALATTIDATQAWLDRNPSPSDEDRVGLAGMKTSFARFPEADCRALVYQGWWLTGACISRYHPELLDGPLPAWRPW